VHVQRARFLELVTAIAAACTPQPAEAPAVVVPVDTMPAKSASPPYPEPVKVDVAPRLELKGTSSRGIWDLEYDEKAAPKSCAQLKCPGPTHEAFGILKSYCTAFSQNLRTEPFQRFMNCMMAHNNTPDVCDLTLIGTEPGDCLEKWAEPSQLDPATEAKCRPLVRQCDAAGSAITMEACRGLLSVTTPRREKKMIHCIVEYCDSAPTLCHIPI